MKQKIILLFFVCFVSTTLFVMPPAIPTAELVETTKTVSIPIEEEIPPPPIFIPEDAPPPPPPPLLSETEESVKQVVTAVMTAVAKVKEKEEEKKKKEEEKKTKEKLEALKKRPKAPFKGINISETKKEIVLGSTGPLSGSLYKLGKDFSSSMGLALNQVNQRQGIHSYLLKLIMRDDEYKQSEIKKNIVDILDKTSILFSTFSSDVLHTIPITILNDLLVVFPNAGDSKFRKKQYSSLFFFRPSTTDEIKALISYATDVLFKRRIAIFYEDSYWGIDGMKFAKKYIDSFPKEKIKCMGTASYVRNTVKVNTAAQKITATAPDTVICIAHYRPAYNFIRQMLNKGMQDVKFLGVSEVSLIQSYLEKSRGVSLISTSVVPNPWKSQLPIAKEYRAAMKQYLPNQKYSTISFEGFINSSLLIKVLETIETPPITRKKIAAALESYTDQDFKGLSISFNPTTRTFSRNIWINEDDDVDWKLFNYKKEADIWVKPTKKNHAKK